MQLAGTGGIWPRPVCVWTPCGVPCSEELCLGNRPLQSLAAQAQHSQAGTQHTSSEPLKRAGVCSGRRLVAAEVLGALD